MDNLILFKCFLCTFHRGLFSLYGLSWEWVQIWGRQCYSCQFQCLLSLILSPPYTAWNLALASDKKLFCWLLWSPSFAICLVSLVMWLVWVCTINILGCLAHFELYSLSSVLDLQRLQRSNLVRWPLVLFPPSTRCFSGWQHFITSCYCDGFCAPIFFTHASFWHNFSASQWCCDNVLGMVSMKRALLRLTFMHPIYQCPTKIPRNTRELAVAPAVEDNKNSFGLVCAMSVVHLTNPINLLLTFS